MRFLIFLVNIICAILLHGIVVVSGNEAKEVEDKISDGKRISWTILPQKMKQVDTGITPYVWATDSNQDVYFLNEENFEQVPGKLAHISSGEAGVWGVDSENQIFFRDGVSSGNPTGSDWKIVKGGLKQIDSGPKGIVCGIDKRSSPQCRVGITEATPSGTKWKRVSNRLEYISCGTYGCWGVNKYNNVYFTSVMNGLSTRWTKIGCDAMVQIETGPNGEVWAVDNNHELYSRLGVSESVPSGLSWKKIESNFRSVTVGLDNVFAVDESNDVYMGSFVPVPKQDDHGSQSPGYVLVNAVVKLCLVPNSPRPTEGTEVIHTSSCRDSSALWRLLGSGAIQHVQSGLCIHLTGDRECPRRAEYAILKQDCSDSRYFFTNTGNRFELKGICLQPRNMKSPGNTRLTTWPSCNRLDSVYKRVDIIKECNLECLDDIQSSKESTNFFTKFFKKSEAEAKSLVPESSTFISTLKQVLPELYKDLFSTFFPVDPQVIKNLEILVNHFGMEKVKAYPSLFLATAFIRRKAGVNGSEPAVCGGTGKSIAGVSSIDEEDAEYKLSLSESELASLLDNEDYKAQHAIDKEKEQDKNAGINVDEFHISSVQKLIDNVEGKYYHKFWTPESLKVAMEECGVTDPKEIKFPPRGDGMSGIEYLEYYFSRDPELLPQENLKFPWPLAIALNIQTSLRQCNWIWRRLEDGERIVRYSKYTHDYDLKDVKCKPSDWNICAVPRIIEDGGVCGRQSTLARVTNHCLGIASGPIKQPAHAAGYNYIKSEVGFEFKIFQGINTIMNTYSEWELVDDFDANVKQINAEFHKGVANAMNHGYESYRNGRIALLIFARIYDAELRHNSRDLLVQALEGNPHMMDVWMKLTNDVTGSSDLPREGQSVFDRIPARCPQDFDDFQRSKLEVLVHEYLSSYQQMYVDVLLRLMSPPSCCSVEQPKYLETLRYAWNHEQRENVQEYIVNAYVSCVSKSASLQDIVSIIKQQVLSKTELPELDAFSELLNTLSSVIANKTENEIEEQQSNLMDFFTTMCDRFPRFHITASAWVIAPHYRACMEAQFHFLETYAAEIYEDLFEEWTVLHDTSTKSAKTWNEYYLKGWLHGRTGDIIPLLIGVKESVDGALIREIKANIARNKPTVMSSQLDTSSSERAVDGNTDPNVEGDSSAVTSRETNPWFRVDLQEPIKIYGLLISNVAEKLGDNLNKFEIHVGDSLEDNGITNPTCGNLHSIPRGETRAFYCDPPLVGQYVTINIPGSRKVLAMSEVAIYQSPLTSYRAHGVELEVWYLTFSQNIHEQLYKDPRYPEHPDFTSRLSSFDLKGLGDMYGSRLSAVYQPLETGNYTFYVSCTDQCEVFLRDGEDGGELDRIISPSKKAGYYQDWNSSADQKSLPVVLKKGKFYELVATLREYKGSDFITLGVKLPTGEFIAPIPASQLFVDTKEESMEITA